MRFGQKLTGIIIFNKKKNNEYSTVVFYCPDYGNQYRYNGQTEDNGKILSL